MARLLYATGTRVSRSSLSLADDFSWWPERCGHRGPTRAPGPGAIAARHRAPAAGACLLYSLSRWCRRSSLVPSFNAALGKRPDPERSTTASAYLSRPLFPALFHLPLSSRTVARVGDRRTSQGTWGERIGATRQRSPLLLSACRFCSRCSFRSSSRMYPRSTYKPTYHALAWKIIHVLRSTSAFIYLMTSGEFQLFGMLMMGYLDSFLEKKGDDRHHRRLL